MCADAALAGVPAQPGAAKPQPLLAVDHLRKSFGGLLAVDVEGLEVQRGTITALIGPNGAGKTTFFNLVTGFDRPDGGRWTFDGRNISRLSPHAVARRGLVRTFQLTKALAKMSVVDNMKLAARAQRGEGFVQALVPFLWRRQEAEIRDRALGLLERFNLAHMADEYAATLSGGQRKLLEVARALMVEPSMLMLDEPVAGVNPALKEKILRHVQELCRGGTSILFVEHDMDVVMGVSHWVVCMAQGAIIAEGPPSAIARNPAVIDAYLGAKHGSIGDAP